MSNNRILFYLNGFLILFTSYFSTIHAQRHVVAAGGEMFSNTASASYSIGQIFYEFGQSGSASIIQGNQQPYEWYVVNTDDPTALKGLNIQFFPNPTIDFLHLEITDYTPGDIFNFYLFSTSGQEIKNQKLLEAKTLISLENMAEGVYFMHIISDRKPHLNKRFKMIKY
jgi:hypothetical protein